MATKFYLSNVTAPYTPATLRGAWDQSSGAPIGSLTRALVPTKVEGGAVTNADIGETNVSNTWDVMLYRGVSNGLDAQTISGTVDLVVAVSESNAGADFFFHVHIYVTQGDSDTPRGTLLSDYVENTTNEWTTTAQGQGLQSAQSLSSLAISAGDRIVVEIGFIARNATTITRNGKVWCGTRHPTSLGISADLTVGSTDTNLAGYVSFSGTITEPNPEVRASQVMVEVASETLSSQRISQLVVEAATAGVPSPQRVSQVLVELASESERVSGGRRRTWIGTVAGRTFVD